MSQPTPPPARSAQGLGAALFVIAGASTWGEAFGGGLGRVSVGLLLAAGLVGWALGALLWLGTRPRAKGPASSEVSPAARGRGGNADLTIAGVAAGFALAVILLRRADLTADLLLPLAGLVFLGSSGLSVSFLVLSPGTSPLTRLGLAPSLAFGSALVGLCWFAALGLPLVPTTVDGFTLLLALGGVAAARWRGSPRAGAGDLP